jgi:hypothetical protein
VARQCCGGLGKIANCQVATTAALWTGARAWFLGAALYLPARWLTPVARQRARIASTVRFQEKLRHARSLLRQVRAAGFDVTAVTFTQGGSARPRIMDNQRMPKTRRPARPHARLTQPLVRDGGALRPATWDDALDRAADGFQRNIDAHGPNALGIFSCSKSTNEVNFLAQKLARVAFGTNNIDSCNRT